MKIQNVTIWTLIILLISLDHASALGLSLAPSTLELNNALKGTEYVQYLVIMNSDNNSMNYSLTSSGDMADWIRYYEQTDLDNLINSVFVKGKENKQIIVKIKIPQETANGNYTSLLTVESVPGNVTSGSSIKLKMSSLLKVNVTGDEILSGTVKSILISDTEENSPLIISVELQNDGNVIANPLFELKVINNNDPEKVIDTVLFAERNIGINKKEIIEVPWNTKGKSLGDYSVKIRISLGGKVLESKDLNFKILPIGTLSRSGKIDKIYITDKINLEQPFKINVDFINTGKINTMAKFSGEIYQDNKLVDTVNSDDLMVPMGSIKTLTAYGKIKSHGQYLIKGKVVFGGKETDVVEYSFNSKSEKGLPGFEVSYLLIIVIVVCHMYRKKRNKQDGYFHEIRNEIH